MSKKMTSESPPTMISVMANAIGFEMFKHRGTKTNEDGVEYIEIDEEETKRCHEAANRAYVHVLSYQDFARAI